MGDFTPQSWQEALRQQPGLGSGNSGLGTSSKLSFNPRLVFALCIITLQFGLALLGSVMWPQDPNAQHLSQVLQAPDYQFLRRTSAELVDLDAVWQPAALPTGNGIIIVQANSERVRLQWPVVSGATSYQLYRYPADQQAQNYGVPLVTTRNSFYEDQLALTATAYRYTVLAQNSRGESIRDLQVVVVLEPAIDIRQWQLNYANADVSPDKQPGDRVELLAHPLGTDHLGRDILARLIAGARTSLVIGLVAPLLAIAIGCLYGALSGLLSGNVDLWLMRFAEFVIALPFLLFMVLFKVVLGSGSGFFESGVLAMILAMVLLNWATTARLVRGQVLQLREQNYVKSARLFGAGYGYLLWRYILPNIQGLLVVEFSFAIPAAIFTEAFLSFIGLGVSPPTASWGVMCQEGMRSLFTTPHELLLPAAMLSLTVLAFNLLGDALRDRSNKNAELR